MTAVDPALLAWYDDADDASDSTCPGIAVHPGRALPNRTALTWYPQPRGPYRVIDYTCCCQAVYYELISVGGIYQVHKVIQSDPLEHLYTGGWNRTHATVWWTQILTGAAR